MIVKLTEEAKLELLIAAKQVYYDREYFSCLAIETWILRNLYAYFYDEQPLCSWPWSKNKRLKKQERVFALLLFREVGEIY